MNARAIERFTNIDIAETGNDALVEQQELDRGKATGQPALQLNGGDVQRLRPECLEDRPLPQSFGPHQIERSEPSGIVERQSPSLVGIEQQMVMLADLGRIDPPVSGHAEVEDERIA